MSAIFAALTILPFISIFKHLYLFSRFYLKICEQTNKYHNWNGNYYDKSTRYNLILYRYASRLEAKRTYFCKIYTVCHIKITFRHITRKYFTPNLTVIMLWANVFSNFIVVRWSVKSEQKELTWCNLHLGILSVFVCPQLLPLKWRECLNIWVYLNCLTNCLCASVVIAKMLFFSSLQLRQLLCMCFFAVHAFSLSFYSQVCTNYLFWLCICSDLSRLLQKIIQLCTNIRNLITHWPNRCAMWKKKPMREKRKKGKDNKIPDCMTNSRLFATRWQRNAWPLAIYEHVIGSSMLIWSYFHLIQ